MCTTYNKAPLGNLLYKYPYTKGYNRYKLGDAYHKKYNKFLRKLNRYNGLLILRNLTLYKLIAGYLIFLNLSIIGFVTVDSLKDVKIEDYDRGATLVFVSLASFMNESI